MNIAKTTITQQAIALSELASNIPVDFEKAIDAILTTNGKVLLLGVGKSGYVARKIASSMSATGTPAFFIHPAEASHGDLGMIEKSDIVIMLSNSGETKELFDTINYCKRLKIPIIAITMNENSHLAKNSDYILNIPQTSEASNLSLPTTSALMMLSLGDAITISLHIAKNFTKDDYFNFHPGGKIGSNLTKINTIMKTGDAMPLVKPTDKFSHVVLIMNEKRLGCASVIDDDMNLLGFITDGDLRRHSNEDLNKLVAQDIMTLSPLSMGDDILASEALAAMNSEKITTMPITSNGKILGIVHIHDILYPSLG